MIKKEVKIKGITYKVSSNTEEGLASAITMLKRSLKEVKKQNKEQDDAISEE